MLLKSKIPVLDAFETLGLFPTWIWTQCQWICLPVLIAAVIYLKMDIKMMSGFLSETSALMQCILCISLVVDL